jgi:hypothetical protein
MSRNTRWIQVLALGSLLAAPAGWAKEEIDTTRDTSREQAREATENATREAVEAVKIATRLELDIRLIGPTSITIASGD